MKKVTIWSVVNLETKEKKHNHIEDGWTSALSPRPIDNKFTNQTAWENVKYPLAWQNESGYLTANRTVIRKQDLDRMISDYMS
jgi:hypothetical protein